MNSELPAGLRMITLKEGDVSAAGQLVLKDFTEHKSTEDIMNAEKKITLMNPTK